MFDRRASDRRGESKNAKEVFPLTVMRLGCFLVPIRQYLSINEKFQVALRKGAKPAILSTFILAATYSNSLIRCNTMYTSLLRLFEDMQLQHMSIFTIACLAEGGSDSHA